MSKRHLIATNYVKAIVRGNLQAQFSIQNKSAIIEGKMSKVEKGIG
jgi:hypothetical protein